MTDARTLTARLHGKWRQSYGTAPCPVCQLEARRDQDALTISTGHDGRLLLHCKKGGCSFADILAAAGGDAERTREPDPFAAIEAERQRKADAEKRQRQAAAIWRGAGPIEGTIAGQYLRGRGITCSLPETMRFAPSCWHSSGRRLPAMVALVDGAEGFAVHRTYLHPDGVGKADASPQKAMLGACRGGAVRLSDGPGPLVVAEGIETGLSLLCGLLRGPAAVWAALSTSGARGLRLPETPGKLIIASDGDAPGRDAAYALAERASALGWAVSLLPAPDGRDWNDVLVGKGVAA